MAKDKKEEYLCVCGREEERERKQRDETASSKGLSFLNRQNLKGQLRTHPTQFMFSPLHGITKDE